MASDHQSETPDPSELIENYMESDLQAFRTIDGWIRGHLRHRYPRMSHLIDDLSQTVHTRLVANLHADRFEGRSSLRGYVDGITHRVAIDRLRRVYRDAAFDPVGALADVPAADNPYAAVESRDEAALCRRVLFSLPEQCRQLWKMTFVDKLRYDEIGRLLKIATGTVKSRLFRCRQHARAAQSRMRLRQRRPARA